MKKLHIILTALNLISIILLVQIVFGWIPSFECNYSTDKMNRINSLIIDLSIGVITSTLFYILLVYLPDKKKAQTAREVNSTNLRYLAENMQFIIIHLIKSYKIKVDKDDYNFSKIDIKEFSKIKSNIFSKDYISGSYEIFLKTNGNSILIGVDDINLEEKVTALMELIQKTLSTTPIIFEDENLIRLLNMIHHCQFFEAIIAFTMGEIDKKRIDYNPTNHVQNFYLLYTILLKYTSPHNFHFEKREKVITMTDQSPHLSAKNKNLKSKKHR